MQFKPSLRKATELGIGLTAIATLILAGCGGGSSSAGGGSSVASTTTTVTPYKGRFSSGNVSLKDANGNAVTLTGGGAINASGVASVSFPSNVTYPITVNVEGVFTDETSGASAVMAAGSPLMGMIPSASDAVAASGIPVTAVTHFARSMFPAYGFSAASAVAAISGAASSVLGVSYSQAMLPPVFDNNGQTFDPTTLKLTALAHVIGQQGGTGDLGARLNNVAAKLAAGSAVGLVLPEVDLNTALGIINGGASSVVSAGTIGGFVGGIAPFAPPNASLINQILAELPTCAAGQVLQPSPTGLQCVDNGSGVIASKFSNVAGGCVQDSKSGLVWEVKTTDGGLRDWNKTYTNFDSTTAAQKGVGQIPTQAEVDAATNSTGYANSVNAAGLCGYNDWRVPSANELRTIVQYSGNPSIDTTWFPNTQTAAYWSSSPLSYNPTDANGATAVGFYISGSSPALRHMSAYVRLVRGGQAVVVSPATPIGVAAAAVSSTQINLTWTAVTGAASYNIYRGTAAGVVAGAASKINTATVTAASFNDTGLTAATTYYYKVAAVNAAGESAGSAEVSAATNAAIVLPTGYVSQGGLTWMPVTFSDTWTNANNFCTTATLNGLTGWRMPTQAELSALHGSGAMNGQGWVLNYTWSSTLHKVDTYTYVDLQYGNVSWNFFGSTSLVSCVH